MLALAALLSCACSASVEVPYVEGSRSAVLLIESGAGVRAFAHDLSAGPDGLAVALDDASERLTVLGHTRTLAELQLEAGELTRETDPLRARPLPHAEGVRTAPAPFDVWSTAPAPGDAAAAFLIPRESAESCAGRGGCLVGRLDERICQLCPERAPLAVPPFPVEPALTPCAAGWIPTPVRNDGALVDVTPRSTTVCDPEPAGPFDCAAGTSALPGAEQCTRVGPPCPAATPWAAVTEPAIYVDAAAVGPGTGTTVDPWRSLDDALVAWTPGMTLALARGTYAPTRALPAGVPIVGACAAETTLVIAVVSEARLASLRVEGDLVASGALVLDGVDARGDLRSSASLDTRDTTITGTVSIAAGRAVLARTALSGPLTLGAGSHASITGSRLARIEADRARLDVSTSLVGATDLDASTAEVTASAVRGQVGVRSGTLTLDTTWLRGSITAADGARLIARDLVLDVQPMVDGVTVHASRVEMTRAFVEGATGAGFMVADVGGAGSELVLRDTLILSTRVRDVGDGQGIRTRAGDIDLSRVLIEDTLGPGITVEGTRGELSLRDLVIADCGDGLRVDGDRTVTVERAVLSGIRGQAIIAGERNASLPVVDLEDVTITGTRRPFCNGNDCPIAGITALAGRVSARRVVIARSEDVALRLATLDFELSDAAITDNPAAVQLEVSGFDLDRVLAGVRYTGHDTLVRRLAP